MAKVCQSPDVLRVDVRPAGQKTFVHGPGVRSMARMEPRCGLGLATSRSSEARWLAPAGATLELHLQKRAHALAAGRFLRRIRVDRFPRCRQQRGFVYPEIARG